MDTCAITSPASSSVSMTFLTFCRHVWELLVQYSTKMIFAVLDISLIMGLNIGETDKVFFTLIPVNDPRMNCSSAVFFSPSIHRSEAHVSRYCIVSVFIVH